MKKVLLLTGLFLFTASVLLTSCKKDDDEDPVLPSITLASGAGYISANAQAGYGDTLTFGVSLSYNETDNLVKFKVSRNSAAFIDSTINAASFNMEVVATKNTDNAEVWIFEVTDQAGNMNALTITVTGAFGDINTYQSVILGAQNNITDPSFLSYSGNTVTTYFQADAFDHQADIDMFCFYENTPGHENLMSLAAPGSNINGVFTGPTAPDFYTTKNVTFFVKTGMTAATFDAVTNDAVILANFDPNNKYKKAKQLTAGEIYAFSLQSGKFGLLKVLSVMGEENGILEFAVKIQQ